MDALKKIAEFFNKREEARNLKNIEKIDALKNSDDKNAIPKIIKIIVDNSGNHISQHGLNTLKDIGTNEVVNSLGKLLKIPMLRNQVVDTCKEIGTPKATFIIAIAATVYKQSNAHAVETLADIGNDMAIETIKRIALRQGEYAPLALSLENKLASTYSEREHRDMINSFIEAFQNDPDSSTVIALKTILGDTYGQPLNDRSYITALVKPFERAAANNSLGQEYRQYINDLTDELEQNFEGDSIRANSPSNPA